MSDTLPASIDPIGNLVPDLGVRGLPPSLQILLNEGLYDRIKQLSGVMSRATGMTPTHLLNKPEACFAIINMALDWKLSPHFCARHTYQTPGGQIGFDGALVQAALEQSGKFVGSPTLEYRGDWQSLTGKFETKEGQRGGKYAVPTWKTEDAAGLGVIVRWQVKGEQVPRVWPGEDDPFWLTQCYPLNSPLWATDPKTQIAYLAIRRFANLTSPGILGAAAFDQDDLIDASERAVDVTPPQREEGRREPEPVDERAEFEIVDLEGVVSTFRSGARAVLALTEIMGEAARDGGGSATSPAVIDRLTGIWESNQATVEQLAREGFPDEAVELARLFDELASRPAVAGSGAGGGPDAGATDGGAPAPASGQAQGSPQTSETPAPAKTPADPEPAPSAPAAATPAPSEQRPFPGDIPAQPATAQPASASSKPADRPSRQITMVIHAGKPDCRAWTVGLFQPKLRQMKTSNDLADLLGDNEDNLELVRKPGSVDAEVLRELEARIAAQWQAVGTT